MQYITRLDVDKYRCVSDSITTDEVILTDERIHHIQKRHPDDYELYRMYLAEIIEAPDYILKDERENTALVLKEIIACGERFRLSLRLATSADCPTYKNSVLTFWRMRKKEWERLLRNKIILYKSE